MTRTLAFLLTGGAVGFVATLITKDAVGFVIVTLAYLVTVAL